MCSAFITMCVSGAIDILREKQCSSGKVSSTKIHIFVDVMYNISDQRTSNLPVYIQLLPNIGISLTRLFGILAIYEFTYFTAPRSAQALFMTFCLFSITISDILPDTLPNLKFDVSSKQNILFLFNITPITFQCHCGRSLLWKQISSFFILAGVQLILIIVFLVSQKSYQMLQLPRP